MNLTFLIFLTLLFIVCPSSTEDSVQNRVINSVISYLRNRQKTQVINILCKSPKNLSTTSIDIMRRIVTELPKKFLLVNTSELQGSYRSENKRMKWLRRELSNRRYRKTFNIFIVDNVYEQEAEQVLIEQLKIFANVTYITKRPRCAFFLVNPKDSKNLRGFFKFSWSQQYLEMIVIEILKSPASLSATGAEGNVTVLLHQYNPFNDTYYRDNFLDRVNEPNNLFIDKLLDLYGYKLSTTVYDSIPMVMLDYNHSHHKRWEMAQGLDVMLTKELAKKLNFSLRVDIDRSNYSMFDRPIYGDGSRLRSAMTKKHIDFVVNLQGMVGEQPLEANFFEWTIFLYPFSSNLIVKLHGQHKYKLSTNLMINGGAVVSIVIIFIILIRLLNMNRQVWSNYNIISILGGHTVIGKWDRTYERVLFISLIITSMFFSADVIEQLLKIILWQYVFPDLKTLADVLDAGILPSVVQSSKESVQSHNNLALKMTLRYSTPMNEEELPECINRLINNDTDEACEINSVLGKIIAKSFSSTSKTRDWIIDLVEEPIVQPCWATMVLSKTSPYVYRFSKILRRFFESGLARFWYKSTMRNFIVKQKYFSEVHLQRKDPMTYNEYYDETKKMHHSIQVGWILAIGYAIACLVFTIEFIVGRRKRSKALISIKRRENLSKHHKRVQRLSQFFKVLRT